MVLRPFVARNPAVSLFPAPNFQDKEFIYYSWTINNQYNTVIKHSIIIDENWIFTILNYKTFWHTYSLSLDHVTSIAYMINCIMKHFSELGAQLFWVSPPGMCRAERRTFKTRSSHNFLSEPVILYKYALWVSLLVLYNGQ